MPAMIRYLDHCATTTLPSIDVRWKLGEWNTSLVPYSSFDRGSKSQATQGLLATDLVILRLSQGYHKKTLVVGLHSPNFHTMPTCGIHMRAVSNGSHKSERWSSDENEPSNTNDDVPIFKIHV
ncbi:hypothetical protein TNCV_248521 [Trichonephila clavipes]|nr:hypothetical protein TNCV_248521 [Trichonephila clavipes]